MLIALGIIILILGIVFHSNKFMTGIILIYMWALFAFNTANADYDNYIYIYEWVAKGRASLIQQYEGGFVLLCRIFYFLLDFSYQQFIIFIATLTTVLLVYIIHIFNIDKFQNIVLVLFVVTQYTVMICQYRSYLGTIVALIGIYLYIWNDNKINLFIAILSLLIGFSFHRSIVLFGVLLFAKHLSKQKCLLLVPIFSVIIFSLRLGAFSSIISRFVYSEKITNWLHSGTDRSMVGIFITVIVRVSLVVVEYYVYSVETKRRIVNLSGDSERIDNYLYSLEAILKISILACVFVPLEFYTKQYERLARLPLFLFGVFYAYYLKEHQPNSIKKVPLTYLLMTSYIVLYIITFYVSYHEWIDGNLIPILTNNMLLDN